MGLWSALGPIPTSFLVLHGVAMMRTTSQPALSPEGQVAQVLGPGVRVAFVFPPWLSNTSQTPMSPSSGAGCCRTRGGTGESCLESKKRCASAHHTGSGSWSWQPGNQVASLMLQRLVFCVEKSSPSPSNLSFGARLPLDQTAPCVEELHQESTSFQPTVLASPPPRLRALRRRNPLPLDQQRLPGHVQCGPTLPVPARFLQLALTQQHCSVDACKLLRNVNCAVLKLRC